MLAGQQAPTVAEQLIQGVPYTDGPRVIFRPSFAVTLQEVRDKLSGVSVHGRATLILDGKDIHLQDVTLESASALVIHACSGAEVSVTGTLAGNEGFVLRELTHAEKQSPETPEVLKMRGYRYVNCGALCFTFDTPGNYEVDLAAHAAPES